LADNTNRASLAALDWIEWWRDRKSHDDR